MLDRNMEQLNFYNFSKTQTCHMNDGILDEIKYREYQFVYQLKVIGNLIVLITSAHRIMTCIKQARLNERYTDGVKNRILYCKDDKIDRQFDFNTNQLQIIDDLIDNIFQMLSVREPCLCVRSTC